MTWISIIPSLAWIVVVLVALFVLRRPLGQLLGRVTGAKVGGVQLTMTADALTDAGEKHGVTVPAGRAQSAAARAEANSDVLSRARILWVDDNPGNNVVERRLMRAFGVQFDLAMTTDEAMGRLLHGDYDLVISDMARAGDPGGGARLADLIHQAHLPVPVIIYTSGIDESYHITPPGVLAVTQQPDRLLHFVLDALIHG